MNVYVETNFILELAFVQQQHESCGRILGLCEDRRAALVVPVFCVAESYETLIRRGKKRKQISEDLDRELAQLGRSKPYEDEIGALRNMMGLLVRSSEEADRRLPEVLKRMLKVAEVIPLDADVISEAASCRERHNLEQQDAVVCASVLHHLASAGGREGCFINRDRAGFDDPDIQESLANKGCKLLFGFDQGHSYIERRVNAALGG